MKAAIIGAGMTGLSLAYFLSRKGFKVDIFEAEETCGGLAASFNYKGHNIDKFYHHFYTHDDAIIELINKIGLGGNIIYETTPNGMFYANRSWSLSSPKDLLLFKPLPLLDRLRMGLLVFFTQKKPDLSYLENITARDWLIKNAGFQSYEVMWEPLLRSKFGRHAEQVSAQWLASKFVKRGGSRSGGGKEKLGYLKGGLGLMIEELCNCLNRADVTINRKDAVISLISEQSEAKGIILESGKKFNGYDYIVSTISTKLTSSLLGQDNAIYKKELQRVNYLANTTLILFLKRSLSNYYWINVNDTECPFVGVIEHTNLLPSREYSGLNIVYIPKYLPSGDPYFNMGKDQILEKYLPWLKRIFPDFDHNQIVDSVICKDTYTQPVITTGYSKLIPQVKTPIKGFYLVTMAQIYPDDRQLSNSVKHARSFVEKFT